VDLVRLDGAVGRLRERLGDSLLALDIWSADTGLSLAGFGLTPATGPMLQRATDDLRRAANAAGTQLVGYHLLTLVGGHVAVVSGDTLDAAFLLPTEVDLGWLLADVIPSFTDSLNAASAGD
jgi:ABC-type multidrug transport system fused ATPase/permease subunit